MSERETIISRAAEGPLQQRLSERRLGQESLETTNHLRNKNRSHLKNFQRRLDHRRGDIEFNPSVNMEILMLCVLKALALKIWSVNKRRQFSLGLDLVISKKGKQTLI